LSRRVDGPAAVGRTISNVGPVFWMSPEALQQTYSEKSDVWAYGVTLYEITAGELPYLGMDLLDAALYVRDQKGNPGIPQTAPKVLAKLMADCWKYNPDDRPTFQQIIDRLGGV